MKCGKKSKDGVDRVKDVQPKRKKDVEAVKVKKDYAVKIIAKEMPTQP